MDGKLIVLAGVDGTGKSSLANALMTNFKANSIPVKYVWMRMNYFFSRPFLLICRLIGLTKRPLINGRKVSIHQFYRFKPLAKLIQYTHFIDTFLSYFKNIYFPLKYKKKIVICDRFVHDILIDFAIEGHEWDIFSKNIAKLFYTLVPHNSLFFLVDLDKENILKRKKDVIDYDEYFDQRLMLYNKLKSNKLFTIVNNNGAIELTLNKIIEQFNLMQR